MYCTLISLHGGPFTMLKMFAVVSLKLNSMNIYGQVIINCAFLLP